MARFCLAPQGVKEHAQLIKGKQGRMYRGQGYTQPQIKYHTTIHFCARRQYVNHVGILCDTVSANAFLSGPYRCYWVTRSIHLSCLDTTPNKAQAYIAAMTYLHASLGTLSPCVPFMLLAGNRDRVKVSLLWQPLKQDIHGTMFISRRL